MHKGWWIFYILTSTSTVTTIAIIYPDLSNNYRLILLFVAIVPFSMIVFSILKFFLIYGNWFYRHFYTHRIKGIQNTISRERSTGEDISNFAGLSMVINFVSMYFLDTVSLRTMLAKIPFFDASTISGEEPVGKAFDIITSFLNDNIFTMLPFVVLGPAILYFLRLLHYRQETNVYLGVRPLLIFIYSMIAVIISYHFITDNIGELLTRELVILVSSLVSLLSGIIIVVLDRKSNIGVIRY